MPTESKIVVVAGALREDDHSEVAAGLARKFAQSRRRTLLLSADLRRSRVHEALGLARSPGLAELLETSSDVALSLDALEPALHPVDVDGGQLDVVTAGEPVKNAAGLLISERFSDLVLELECSDYDHVVVEGPALLGSVHGQLVARYGAALLVVSDPERLSPSDAVELGELIHRLDPAVAGFVAVGARGLGPYPVALTVPRRVPAGHADG